MDDQSLEHIQSSRIEIEAGNVGEPEGGGTTEEGKYPKVEEAVKGD